MNSKTNLYSLHDQIIDEHEAYLGKLQDAFTRQCEAIRVKSHEEMNALPEAEKEARKAVVMKEKELLDQTLAQLKQAIRKSSDDIRKKLEEIERKMEEEHLNLDKQLSAIK